MSDENTNNDKIGISDGNFNIGSETNEGKNDDEILSRRPWKLSSVELETSNRDIGVFNKVWVSSVIDSNGNMVCYGNAADMEFIVDMENSFDKIMKFVQTNKDAFGKFYENFERFAINRKKIFIHN